MGLNMFIYERIDIGEWRKAYAIHNWFVKYVQDGNDDGDVYEVRFEHIEKLKDFILQVKKSKKLAPILIPYPDYIDDPDYSESSVYWGDLDDALEICDKIMQLYNKKANVQIEYTAG
jgi:hypothetical protein